MNKYIDAEELIAEINNRLMEVNLEELGNFGSHRVWAYNDVKGLITSLQQEHPEGLYFIPLNRLIQKIPSENWNYTVNNYARKLRDCLIREGYMKDAEVLQDYISYMNGNNVPMATMDEQPEDNEERFESIDNAFRRGRETGFREGVESVKPTELEQLAKLREMTHEIREAYERGIEVGSAKSIEWSEEDERKYQCVRCILLTDADKKIGSWKYSEILSWYEKRGVGRYTNSEPHWKPSEEQMEALEHFIRSWGESGTMSPQNTILCAAKSLYNDLKKL